MEENYNVEIEVPFPSKKLAHIAFDVLRVDAEPKRGGVTKELICVDNHLRAKFSAALAKQLRVAVNNFYENITLISEITQFFGDPVSTEYSHYF